MHTQEDRIIGIESRPWWRNDMVRKVQTRSLRDWDCILEIHSKIGKRGTGKRLYIYIYLYTQQEKGGVGTKACWGYWKVRWGVVFVVMSTRILDRVTCREERQKERERVVHRCSLPNNGLHVYWKWREERKRVVKCCQNVIAGLPSASVIWAHAMLLTKVCVWVVDSLTDSLLLFYFQSFLFGIPTKQHNI